MSKIYLVRHQAAGFLHEFPFASAPTESQMAALAKLTFQRHGATHPKTKEPYWLRVDEFDVLGASDVPSVPDRALVVANVAGAPEFDVKAEGHVKNPK